MNQPRFIKPSCSECSSSEPCAECVIRGKFGWVGRLQFISARRKLALPDYYLAHKYPVQDEVVQSPRSATPFTLKISKSLGSTKRRARHLAALPDSVSDASVDVKLGDDSGFEAQGVAQDLAELGYTDAVAIISNRYCYMFRVVRLGFRGELCVKVLHPEFADNRIFREVFEREAATVVHFDHPNIVAVYKYGYLKAGAPYTVSQFVEGLPLKELLPELSLIDLFQSQSSYVRRSITFTDNGWLYGKISLDSIHCKRLSVQNVLVKLLDVSVKSAIKSQCLSILMRYVIL